MRETIVDLSPLIHRLSGMFVERFSIEVPSPDTDLLESGILDSLQLVELLLHLEQGFGFRVSIETLELDNLRTLRRLAGVLVAQTGAAAVAAVLAADAAAPPLAAVDAPGRIDAPQPEAGRKASDRAKPRDGARLTLVGTSRESTPVTTPPVSVQGSG